MLRAAIRDLRSRATCAATFFIGCQNHSSEHCLNLAPTVLVPIGKLAHLIAIAWVTNVRVRELWQKPHLM
jgi:hypothetical protein